MDIARIIPQNTVPKYQTDNHAMSKAYQIKRRVRFGDCDPGGVIYTPNISFYIVESVRAFMDELLETPMEKAILDMGILPPAKAFSVEFISFLKWDDQIDILVRIKNIGTSSFTFSIVGYRDDEPTFSSEFTQVCVNPETKRPTPIPDVLRAKLTKYKNGE